MKAPDVLHPTDQLLRAYGLGELDETSAESVHDHLEGCPDCRQRVGSLSADSFLDRLREADVQPAAQSPAVGSTDGLSILDGVKAAQAPPPASTLPPGIAGHPDYEVIRELGRGGMGVVYLARNRLMGRMEVLKVVGGHLVSRPAILDRFLREIRSAARLHHPNIVTAYAALRFGESLCLSMEYVDGLDLARLVKARGPLPVANACNYVSQAALGLQHAHEHGMVHRDIKPANLILARAGGRGNRAIVKVLDFGLAKVTVEGQRDSELTREGQMLGTPDYIAPEQIRDAQSADIRADIYSLGCTLYYLLTGKAPFKGDNLWDIYQAHFSMDATPLNLARPDVPVELAALVAKMMVKEPARRFQEPKQVAQALRPFFKPSDQERAPNAPDVSSAGPSVADRDTPGTEALPTPPPPGSPAASTHPDRTYAMRPSTPAVEPVSRETEFGTPEVASQGRHRRVARWAIAGVVLAGIATLLAAVVLKVRTRDGMIVLEGVPADAVVEVDGGVITVTPSAGQPFRIEQPAGTHRVKVTRGGEQLLGENLTLESGREARLAVRLEHPKGPEPAGIPPGSDNANAPAPSGDATVDVGTTSAGPAAGDPPRVGPAPKEVAVTGPKPGHTPRPEGFVPLFTGSDLAGWEDVRRDNASEWKLVNGVLSGRGLGGPAVLVNQRRDLKDFRLRAVYRFTKGGGGRIELRRSGTAQRASFYAAFLNVEPLPLAKEYPAGNIKKFREYRYGNRFGISRDSRNTHAAIGDRHLLEVVAVGNRIATSVDGVPTDEYVDEKGPYLVGQIALVSGHGSTVEFTELSIQVPPDGAATSKK